MVVGNKPSKFRTISRVSTSTKATVPSRKSNYQGQDSNLHAFRHQILSLARLPIPPPWQISYYVDVKLLHSRKDRPRRTKDLKLSSSSKISVYKIRGSLVN